jgi:hypothetical protein
MLIDLSRVRISGPLSAFATGFADLCVPKTFRVDDVMESPKLAE